MVRLGVGAALAQPCCCPGASYRLPASSLFLSRRCSVALASRRSVFLSSRLRGLKLSRYPNPSGRRLLTKLVRAETQDEEDTYERDGTADDDDARLIGGEDEDEDDGPRESESVFMPNLDGDDDDDDAAGDGERVGPVSWLKEKFRRKSKEELEAEAERKTTEVFEVRVRICSNVYC